MRIHIICIIVIILLSTPVYAENMPEYDIYNLDESMCPNCENLTKAVVLVSYDDLGYGRYNKLMCVYDLETRDGHVGPDKMTFSYLFFKTAEEASIWVNYYQNEKQNEINGVAPPFYRADNRVLPIDSQPEWMETPYSAVATGNYYTTDNIAARMSINFHSTSRGFDGSTVPWQDMTKEEALKKVEEMSSCQKELKEPPEFKGIPIRLHIDDHPLKNLKVIINDKTYTTNENGEVKIPENGEATLQFIYFDDKEYFSIYVFDETQPLELQIKTENGIVTEGILKHGEGSTSIRIDKKITDFNFENLAGELYSTAQRYVHLSEALEFYQDLGVDFKKPVKVVTFVQYDGIACYSGYKIFIDSSVSSANHKWFPFTEYHEFSHYAMNQMYGDEYFTELLKSPNHGGFANPTTTDSWMEGFAAFMPVVIANHYDRWWTDRPLEKRPSYYPMAGSLDANYKAWEREGKAEEFAIAGFLWDFIDGEKLNYTGVKLSDDMYWQFFEIWDDNKDKKVTAEEMYVGQIMDIYSSSAELDYTSWYQMIEMGKDMEDYFDLEPDMELFDKYDDGDGFLDEQELDKMSDILNDDGFGSEWLKYYDDGDRKISKEEAKHLLKGYEIIMEISKGQEVSDRNDVKEWVEDKRIRDYIDENGMRPIKDEISPSEFTEYMLEHISGDSDDTIEWSFDVLWEDVLSKKHPDFTSVLESLDSDVDENYMDGLGELVLLHGMYQTKSQGDGVYNVGEAYADTNKNKSWDGGEIFIDYPSSWDFGDNDVVGAPSNYERIGRRSTPYFEGNYIKAPEGEYEITYLIKDGMKIIDIVGYTDYSDGMMYVPIPSDSIVSVSSEDDQLVFTSKSFEENYEEIVKRGYVGEIKKSNNNWIWVLILISIVMIFYVRRKKKSM